MLFITAFCNSGKKIKTYKQSSVHQSKNDQIKSD